MQKKTILLTAFGSFGDIHPYMALSLELIERGHKAVLGTSEIYRNKIESAGILFEPVRPDLPMPGVTEDTKRLFARIMDEKVGTEVVIKEVVLGSLNNTHEDLHKAAISHKADIIIAHALSYASPIVSEQLKIPWVFTALQPIIMFSADDPSAPPDMPWVLHFRRFGADIYRKMMEKGTAHYRNWAEPIFLLRKQLCLSDGNSNPLLGGHFSPYLNLAMFSKHFAPPAADWPQNIFQTGFSFYDEFDSTQKALPSKLEHFLNAGEPPVIFTLGTAAVRNAGNFYVQSLQAARQLKKRSLLLTGVMSDNEIGLDLKNDAFAIEYAPYKYVFPRGCAIVHQGGIGTTSQVLRAGKPMLIMPYGHDQPDNAARCIRLGVAKSISRRNYCAMSAAKNLSSLLSSSSVRKTAEIIRDAISVENGPSAACDRIEALLG